MILALALLTGCGSGSKVSIVQQDTAADASTAEADSALVIDTHDYDGTMRYEVIDAYVTTDLDAHDVNLDKIDPYMSVQVDDGNGAWDYMDWPDFMDESENLTDGCRMYIVKLRVTNTDATYLDEELMGYGSPYIFRADNITLNYVSADQKTVIPTTISYYSLRQEDNDLWCTFQLEPGESIEYEIGFILGPVLASGQDAFAVTSDQLFLCGGDNSTYQISWEER
jgi:hypothetical protein